jgi:tetratricopeptide (TPR) repeat protein
MNARLLPIACLVLCACGASPDRREDLPPGAEAFSLQGEALYPLPLPPEEQQKREDQLLRARADYAERPDDPLALIWVGRRLGYLLRFQEAIDVFSEGIAKHPDDPRMWRFRGHRYISVRDFERAESDLEHAAKLVAGRPDEIEPAGVPNARGIAIDTLNQNVYYHLGLAHYLQGDFEGALPAWRECLRFSTNPDAQCSATYWLYMTLARAGREAEGKPLLDAIRADFDIVEYFGYHNILLAYKGLKDPDELFASTPPSGAKAADFATIGYGIGNLHYIRGNKARAREIFEIVAHAEAWAAFGRIAAEVELER